MREIILDMRSGLIDPVQIPDGTKVIIRDYDVDGFTPEDQLKEDEDGEKYLEIIHD